MSKIIHCDLCGSVCNGLATKTFHIVMHEEGLSIEHDLCSKCLTTLTKTENLQPGGDDLANLLAACAIDGLRPRLIC